MYTSAKGKLGLASLFFALFFVQFFVLGTFYSDSTDTFWVNNLLQQGVNDFEIFYVFISSPLAYLYSLFPSVPFSNLLLYSLLLVLGLWLSVHLKNVWFVILFYFLVFSETVLLLDFTGVSILVVLLSVVLFLELGSSSRYFLVCFIVVAACIRHTSIVYSLFILSPYLLYVFFHKRVIRNTVEIVSVLIFVFGAFSAYFSLNEDVLTFRESNNLRAKMVDYNRGVEESGGVNIEFLSRGLQKYDAPNKTGFKDPILSFPLDKSITKVEFLFARLSTTYLLYIVFILLMLIYVKSRFHWVNFCYIIGVLFFLCFWYKMPDRLLLPVLSVIPLLLFFEERKRVVYDVYVVVLCFSLFASRMILKSVNLNRIQALKEAELCEVGACSSYRSYGLNKRLLYLNPISNYNEKYVSRTVPLGGWVGLLSQVQKGLDLSSVFILEKDKEVVEEWLGNTLQKNEACSTCYSIKKGTSK